MADEMELNDASPSRPILPVLATYRARTFNELGDLVRDFEIDATEPPEFYVHQLLHVAGVACVQLDNVDGGDLILRGCDPGLDFEEIVGSAP